ncbi:MAG: glycosyltransferase [Actinobacteria bacterium]|nr:glycosyltransferase [Actinomycetota bacterium]
MRIHQLLVSASPGDAITNEALEIKEILAEFGESEVYARYVHPEVTDRVSSLESFPEARPESQDDFIFFHGSIGEHDIETFLEERPERLIQRYHNISPPDSFKAHDPDFGRLLMKGRDHLASLHKRTELALAASSFNAEDLKRVGYSNIGVSPLIVDAGKLLRIEPHPPTVSHLETLEGPLILFVGQLLPHKRPDLVLSAFHVLMTYLQLDAHLVLAGASRLPEYQEILNSFLVELNLHRVWLAADVPTEELVAFYRRADLFVTLSEHEGFCVPLLEAMAFEIPILARACAAIPETLGDAGLLLPPSADLLLTAEAMAEILNNDELASSLVQRGNRRLKDFDPEISKKILRDHLLTVM